MNNTAQRGDFVSPRKKASPHILEGNDSNFFLKLLDILNVLKHLIFPVIMVILGFVAFCLVAPGKDMMRILGSDLSFIWQLPASLFTIWWSTTLWYGSRVLLHHSQIEYIDQSFSEKVQAWAPRIIGMFAFLDVLVGILIASDKIPWLITIVYILLGAITLIFLIYRRKWFSKYFKIEGFNPAPVKFNLKTFYKDWPYITFSILLFFTFFVLILISPVGFSRWLNPIGIILTAFAGWSMLGLCVKVIDKVVYFPVLTTIFLLSILFGRINFNNSIPKGQKDNNVTIQQYFDQWYLNKSVDTTKPFPVFIVTAEGGASRSAYWTGDILTKLQERNVEFYNHTFALTSVSGGSLGVSSFFVLMENKKNKNDSTGLNKEARDLLKKDFLSPVSAGMLYPNLLQQFLPFKWKYANRAGFLEKGWVSAWKEVSGLDFSQPFVNYWNIEDAMSPLLFLNTTHVESGKRAVISYAEFNDTLSDLFDLMHNSKVDAGFTLQKAVSSSAAFPYISPSARVQSQNKIWGNIVDGGYYENSSVYTAIDIYNNMKNSKYYKYIDVYFVVIRAFPDGDVFPPSLFLNEATDPLKAIFNTRGARSPHSNKLLETLVGSEKVFKIQLNQDVAVSWYISEEGINKMNNALNTPLNKQAMDKIIKTLEP